MPEKIKNRIESFAVSTKLLVDTVQKMRVLASFESQDSGETVTMQAWAEWMVNKAYDAALALRGRKVSIPSGKKK